MSAALAVLPTIWAYTVPLPAGVRKGPSRVLSILEETGFELRALVSGREAAVMEPLLPVPEAAGTSMTHVFPVEYAGYRKYTEALLRRYNRLSMEAGRTPSLLGRELFRGRVTSYRVQSFEDAVIFVHDVERCLGKLDGGQRYLVRRIALQEYTQGETSEMTGLSLRTVIRRYLEALDRLTGMFLERSCLTP